MRSLGNAFEQRACAELERAGLVLLDRSYTTRFGEIDLVMSDGDTVVFIEVRYRKHAAHGTAAESSCRFDVITYDGAADAPRASWLRGAFDNE
jgi:putative endonuclease